MTNTSIKSTTVPTKRKVDCENESAEEDNNNNNNINNNENNILEPSAEDALNETKFNNIKSENSTTTTENAEHTINEMTSVKPSTTTKKQDRKKTAGKEPNVKGEKKEKTPKLKAERATAISNWDPAQDKFLFHLLTDGKGGKKEVSWKEVQKQFEDQFPDINPPKTIPVLRMRWTRTISVGFVELNDEEKTQFQQAIDAFKNIDELGYVLDKFQEFSKRSLTRPAGKKFLDEFKNNKIQPENHTTEDLEEEER